MPSRPSRRILIALLILLLILLPLYLWPLRGGLGALQRAFAPSGPPKDPRNAAALATIPRDVWDALMAGAAPPLEGPPKPRNLTMIAEHQPGAAAGAFDPDAGGSPAAVLLGGVPAPSALAGLTDQSEYKENDEGSYATSTPGQFGSGPYGGGKDGGDEGSGGEGNGGGWYGGGLPTASMGPFSNGGPNFSNSIISLDAGDPAALQPTPEPATIALVGLNVAVLSAIAWKRRRRGQEAHSIG